MNENLDDNEPGALNTILAEQFKARIRAVMTKSPNLRALLGNVVPGGLHIAVDKGAVKRARVELQGDDVTALIQEVIKADPGLTWLVAKLEKGSLTISTDDKGEEEYKVLRQFKRDKFGYVK